MKKTIEFDLPFEWCAMCPRFEPTNQWLWPCCAHEDFCTDVENVRRRVDEHQA